MSVQSAIPDDEREHPAYASFMVLTADAQRHGWSWLKQQWAWYRRGWDARAAGIPDESDTHEQFLDASRMNEELASRLAAANERIETMLRSLADVTKARDAATADTDFFRKHAKAAGDELKKFEFTESALRRQMRDAGVPDDLRNSPVHGLAWLLGRHATDLAEAKNETIDAEARCDALEVDVAMLESHVDQLEDELSYAYGDDLEDGSREPFGAWELWDDVGEWVGGGDGS